jgi:hypothetical protein
MPQRPHICFDRILPQALFRPQATIRLRSGRTRGISPIGKTWMNGSSSTMRRTRISASPSTRPTVPGPTSAPTRAAFRATSRR